MKWMPLVLALALGLTVCADEEKKPVITVPKGGDTYRVTCLKAVDESMEILGEYMFESRG